ncbi:hypothetical protein ACFU8R_28090 [Pseudonocardia alni]|jgi:presenilin-like A22 family membrane protease|uniref:hypothetical protein n=1 Tax=Pseudonocardia alni TaxID=33907 RepID=UPI0036B2A8CD
MKLLDLVLTAVTVLSVTVVIAYVGLAYDTGLFTVLPEPVTAFFLRNGSLQWVALAVLVVGLIGKTLVGRMLKQRRPQPTRS